MAVSGSDSDLWSIKFAAEIINFLMGLVDEKSALADEKIAEAIGMADNVPEIEDVNLSGISAAGLMGARPVLPAAPNVGQAPTIGAKPLLPGVPTAPVLAASPIIPTAPVLDAPPVLNDLDVAQLQMLFASNRLDIEQQLVAAFRSFADEWFPSGGYFDKATAWLERALGEGGSGINVDVENAIYERDRSRLVGEAESAEDEALNNWSARGYSMPPGALSHNILTVRLGLNKALAQQSREIAIKAHQDELDNARLAVQQAIALRNNALSACINYMQVLAVGPQLAVAMANAQVDAQTKMASTRADVFRTVTGAKTDLYKAVAGVEADVYRTVAGAKGDFYKAEVGAKTDLYRAEIDGWRSGVTAEADAYRATTGAEAERYRAITEALTRLYSTDAQVAALPVDAAYKQASLGVNMADANLKAKLQVVDAKVRAAVAAAQQVATQASAALNNLNVGANVSNGTSTNYSGRAPDL